MKKDKVLRARVETNLYYQCLMEAQEQKVKISELVRDALRCYFRPSWLARFFNKLQWWKGEEK